MTNNCREFWAIAADCCGRGLVWPVVVCIGLLVAGIELHAWSIAAVMAARQRPIIAAGALLPLSAAFNTLRPRGVFVWVEPYHAAGTGNSNNAAW